MRVDLLLCTLQHWLETSPERAVSDKRSIFLVPCSLGSLTLILPTLLRWKVELPLLPFVCAARPSLGRNPV